MRRWRNFGKMLIYCFFIFSLKVDELFHINSHAVGMAVEQPLDFDFARNPISGSAA